VPRSRRLPHDQKISILQVSDEVIGHKLRHDIIAVFEPAATVMLERKAQPKPKLIRIGGGQFGIVIGHAERLDPLVEHIKNIWEALASPLPGQPS
jgi:hypothetical protein